jgi:ankyrin repeat protein
MSGKTPKRKARPGVDRMGRTDLHYAANDGDLPKVVALIAAGCDVSLADDSGWTPLHFAAQANSRSIAAVLLEAGATVDPQDSNGNSPLFRAVFNSRGDGILIGLLRQHGANPNLENLHGVSPLILARRIANSPVAQFFGDLPQTNEDV